METTIKGRSGENLHNLAILFKNAIVPLEGDSQHFEQLQKEHQFQNLTESNKLGTSFRKGLYMSKVKNDEETQETQFHLLRCSTNLDGPTEGFKKTDEEIIAQVNQLAIGNFDQPAELNHVLAQVYENSMQLSDQKTLKEKKAKIKQHSDKTKDMPSNGLIAFVTFYSNDIDSLIDQKSPDKNEYMSKSTTVLTSLLFKKKEDAMVEGPDRFSVLLYPNSVLLIPLSTNRTYTHEIVPSILPVARIPVRLGYVIRCSDTVAIHKDGKTFIEDTNGSRVKLEEATSEGTSELKMLYLQENVTSKKIHYPEVNFSLNTGDYSRPLY